MKKSGPSKLKLKTIGILKKGVGKKPNSDEARTQLFREVYKQYFEQLFRYAYVITDAEGLAKDVVSDVFFNLWNSKKDLRTIKQLKAYLFTAVKNQAIRSISSDPSSFERNDYDLITRSIDQINPEDLMIAKELEEFISLTVMSLPPQCQLVFKMVREKNMSHKEVARELGIGPDTVKHHLMSAIKKIKHSLDEHFTEAPVVKLVSSIN